PAGFPFGQFSDRQRRQGRFVSPRWRWISPSFARKRCISRPSFFTPGIALGSSTFTIIRARSEFCVSGTYWVAERGLPWNMFPGGRCEGFAWSKSGDGAHALRELSLIDIETPRQRRAKNPRRHRTNSAPVGSQIA